jgi:hypothetical protein
MWWCGAAQRAAAQWRVARGLDPPPRPDAAARPSPATLARAEAPAILAESPSDAIDPVARAITHT